MLKVVISVRL